MDIYPLLSTKKREIILGYLLEHPSERINMNKLAAELRLSVGQIHKYVSILRKMDLVEKDEFKDLPTTRALRLLWNLKRINEANIVGILLRDFRELKGIGIYGSWASGTNLGGADLDIWLKMKNEPRDEELARVRKEIERKIGIPVDIIVATPERLEHFRNKSDSFYFSLYNGRILWGEGL